MNLVALVTGAASGFGLSTAERLLKQGAKVVLCDINSSKGQEVAKRHEENSLFIATDVTCENDVKKALETCSEKFQKLDLLVNCAGINVLGKTYDFQRNKPHSLEEFTNILQVNTVGTFNVIRLAVGLMAKNQPDEDGQKGVIVNLTSIHAYGGSTGHIAYSASSGAIASMTLPLARDLSSEGIRCCAIATGLFDTPYYRSLPDKYKRFIPSLVPFPKGLGSPTEFAHLVQTILENKMLNGEVIRLDGALRFDV
ncbi:3-hydroxyacyl-CoA dehydrogenase type-2 isoform X2 [Parasteatoda tepidariorum]|uniref:3-hydroxyacyl-CoA dehydrogenase type-2 isoform X2 n=1 Tax=Parasteatoda tepidariorum TaxID=114398 RepID=UPI001C724B27|nr:3-hydroxyacyl-CoA dehydrogenase type-2 isoform X2 [Parasteatoda tepidariorum]